MYSGTVSLSDLSFSSSNPSIFYASFGNNAFQFVTPEEDRRHSKTFIPSTLDRAEPQILMNTVERAVIMGKAVIGEPAAEMIL